MAKIVINEISQNYTFNIGANSYATVAMPITSCWGPGYFDPSVEYQGEDPSAAQQSMLEHTVWRRFPATQQGLESFISTYRGPASIYRLAKDYSYQMAITLLTAGYDVLVCRMCPGQHAKASLVQNVDNGGNSSVGGAVTFEAKYPGAFGNNLIVTLKKAFYHDSKGQTVFYWNAVTYVVDASGVKSSVENKPLTFNLNTASASDVVPYYKEVESDFWNITSVEGTIAEDQNANIPASCENATQYYIRLGSDKVYEAGAVQDTVVGTDFAEKTRGEINSDISQLIKARYDWAEKYQFGTESDSYPYVHAAREAIESITDLPIAQMLYYREWLFTNLVGTTATDDTDGKEIGGVFDLLKDKLSYNPQRVISPGWDDQDLFMYNDDPDFVDAAYEIDGKTDTCKVPISPMHLKIMDVAYYGRCATGYIDVPHVVARKFVHIENEFDIEQVGYVQKLARVTPENAALEVNGSLFHTHCAFFAPWGQYTYVGTSKMSVASPSFLALMIQRAQILNQPIQYEWALPTDRKHNLRIGKMEYTVPKKVLDKWQKLEGASVNVITTIPDLGTNIWGNSTLFEVPPATYQALANMSTRFLVNAVEDCAYRCGLNITFQYNNDQAYNKFYAGVTPLLDTMKNVGAIEDYRVEMSADINGLDHVNANTVIGKIWLIVNGVINDIYVDLIALPAGLGIDLNSLS